MNVRRFADADSLDVLATDRFVEAAKQAIRERGVFSVALSGGSTPVRMYRQLLTQDVDWSRVRALWSDDRYVPPSEPESNEGVARRELLSKVPISAVFGMYVSGGPEAAAAAYEKTLGDPANIDLVLLGMGPDGHTASLFPGEPSVEVTDKWVVASHAPVGIADRITFTIPAISAARSVLLLVAGTDKADAWARVESGDLLPTRRVLDRTPQAEVYVYT